MGVGRLTPRTVAADCPCTIGGLLRRSVARAPSADAIVTPGEALTYRQLDARTTEFAQSLVAIGAGKGTRIGLLAPDGPLWLIAFLAATRIGALVSPISTLATGPELAHILRHSDAQILIGVRRFLRHDYAERLKAALPDLPRSGPRAGALHLEAAPYLRSIWLDDARGSDWASSHAELLAQDKPPAGLIAAMEAEVVGSDDAVVIYTSGSSASPKAVLHTHRSAAQHSQVIAEQFRIQPSDRLMPLLPLFWVGGLVMALEVLGAGATLVYPASPSLDDVAAAIEGLSVNRINSWGPQLEKVRQVLQARGLDPDAIGGLAPQRTSEGVAVPPDRAANMLGMTESFGPHSSEPLGVLMPDKRRGASGRATSDYERRVVDPETGEVLGPGASGELQLRRGGLMRGYYKMDPDRVFTADGYFPTSDIVRIDEDGYLYFERRGGDMLKTGGANVSRLEVEAALRLLPEVAQAIVVGLPDDAAGQVVAAAVVPSPGQAPTAELLKAALRRLVSSYKVPKHIVLISAEEIPWTPSQKVQLGEMARMIADRISAQGGEQGAPAEA